MSFQLISLEHDIHNIEKEIKNQYIKTNWTSSSLEFLNYKQIELLLKHCKRKDLKNNTSNNNIADSFKNIIANIEKLNLFNCQISSKSFLQILNLFDKKTRLKKLDLSNNNFCEFKFKLGMLQELKTLKLSQNKIQTVDFFELLKIQNLDLSFNQITNVESIFENLPHLKKLNLSNNCLKSIDLKNCQLIENLDLSVNSLIKIENLDCLLNIKRLNLYGNKLMTFCEKTLYLPKILYLNLKNNNLNSIPTLFCKNLKEINIEQNDLLSINLNKFIFPCIEILKVDKINILQFFGIENKDVNLFLEKFTKILKKKCLFLFNQKLEDEKRFYISNNIRNFIFKILSNLNYFQKNIISELLKKNLSRVFLKQINYSSCHINCKDCLNKKYEEQNFFITKSDKKIYKYELRLLKSICSLIISFKTIRKHKNILLKSIYEKRRSQFLKNNFTSIIKIQANIRRFITQKRFIKMKVYLKEKHLNKNETFFNDISLYSEVFSNELDEDELILFESNKTIPSIPVISQTLDKKNTKKDEIKESSLSLSTKLETPKIQNKENICQNSIKKIQNCEKNSNNFYKRKDFFYDKVKKKETKVYISISLLIIRK